MTDTQSADPLQQARDIVDATGEHLFLTGKAGTGKTTFLHQLKEQSAKRLIVTAPTGVAAMNAGGVTLHSFFQLPFGPILPDAPQRAGYRFGREKVRIIQALDLLVIDEVSMVRADLLDGVDAVLRRYRKSNQPFGGVQLLLIGDLHQLPPVLNDRDQALLQNHYPSPYFFDSLALRQTGFFTVELTKVFRQRQPEFIELLNAVRDNQWTPQILQSLNQRVAPAQQDDPAITLTTHNRKADRINIEQLSRLSGPVHRFQAQVDGDFPESMYPVDAELQLKTGARVIFTKNDTGESARFYNGKVGRVVSLQGDEVRVECDEDGALIRVEAMDWQNVSYAVNEASGQLEEQVRGRFSQLPLRLAWAITIHKSQGLTFERVQVDAQDAFAQGQVYVALSRCRSLEGLLLTSPVVAPEIDPDPALTQFDQNSRQSAPDQPRIAQAMAQYQHRLLADCFDFASLEQGLREWSRLLNSSTAVTNAAAGEGEVLLEQARTQLLTVGNKFHGPLQQYCLQGLAEQQPELQQRLVKAGQHFAEPLAALETAVNAITFSTDNSRERKRYDAVYDQLKQTIAVKRAVFDSLSQGFTVQALLNASAQAAMQSSKAAPKKTQAVAPAELPFPELFEVLRQWRLEEAQSQQVPAFTVLHQKALIQMACHLPDSKTKMLALAGVGPKTVERYGDAILACIREFAAKSDIDLEHYRYESSELQSVPEGKPASKARGAWQDSLALFRGGESIADIAQKQGLTASTIENHLAKAVEQGDLELAALLTDSDKEAAIREAFVASQGTALRPVKEALGDRVSYGEIRWVQSALNREGSLPEETSG